MFRQLDLRLQSLISSLGIWTGLAAGRIATRRDLQLEKEAVNSDSSKIRHQIHLHRRLLLAIISSERRAFHGPATNPSPDPSLFRRESTSFPPRFRRRGSNNRPQLRRASFQTQAEEKLTMPLQIQKLWDRERRELEGELSPNPPTPIPKRSHLQGLLSLHRLHRCRFPPLSRILSCPVFIIADFPLSLESSPTSTTDFSSEVAEKESELI
ncbi:unnamed protein product [Linum trigynum]|uniref:Uncharacterized protein n=1 Tax=Linum trigynum TaxID=586398 RepID=A0AAV2CXS7_9ROSI